MRFTASALARFYYTYKKYFYVGFFGHFIYMYIAGYVCALRVYNYLYSSVSERIKKALAAFFSHGQLGYFHGLLNPLSSRSIVESCILPVLMYGSESWVLNTTLLLTLESFQAEVGKRILRLPKFTSNNIPLLALNWTSMCAKILCSKLSFLYKVCHDQRASLSS